MTKNILITGAGSGIGKESALKLIQRGHKVIATTENTDQAIELGAELESKGLEAEVFKLDVTDEADRQKVIELKIDVLINNAGTGESGNLGEIDIDRVRQNFEVNVFSALELTQLVLKQMFERNSGTVIFVSSLAGRIVLPFLGPYCMTKFALSSGAETMRQEIHRVRKNVHISLIEPGAYHTGFNQKNIAKKYEWMDKDSIFYPILERIKKEEEQQFRFTESKSVDSIVHKIVKATEAKRPALRYSAPLWQAWGAQLLRIFGK